MAPQFKKLTDCPENLREAIDWMIQVRNGGDKRGLEKLAEALKQLVEEAIQRAYTTNVNALLQLLDSAKTYTCCKDKVANIGKLKDPKSLESKHFNDLENWSESIKNCYKSHLDDSQQKAYVDIRYNLGQLCKLKESLTGLTDQNSCEKLLENLCHGVETFLGFDPSSKGYDGSGIVYSDLDRLCDAVMGFLKGVLESVKNENEVTTYDKHITPDENRLEKVLSKLQSSIGTGRAGLVDSVDAVREWLEGYNEEVGKKTKAVTDALTTLMNAKIEKHENEINPHNGLNTQLMFRANVLGDIGFEVEKIDNENVNKLDKSLKEKVQNEIEPIKKSVEMLKNSAKQDEFVEQAAKVESELEEQQKKLKRHLLEHIFHIRASVTALRDAKDTHISDVKKAVKKAEALFPNFFDKRYKDGITWHFDNIKMHVDDLHNMVCNKKIELGALVADAQRYFKEIQLGVGSKNGLRGFIYNDWEDLKIMINGLVNQSKGVGMTREQQNDQGIKQIEEGVRKYAETYKNFGDASLKNALDDWIDEIVKNDPVKEKLRLYVERNSKGQLAHREPQGILSGADETLHKAIKKYIKQEIKSKVSGAFAPFSVREESIESYITAVQAVCSTFATKLGEHIKEESNLFDLENTITDEVEQELTSEKTSNNDLYDAVDITLTALVATANQVITQLQSFLNESKLGSRLVQIGNTITQIGNEFNDSGTGQYGKSITDKLSKVKENIDALSPILHQSKSTLKSEVESLEGVIMKLDTLKNGKDTDGSVEKGRSTAETLMDELKADITHKLNNICAVVNNANYALDTAIEKLRSTITEAHTNSELAITSAFSTVTSEVRTLFADAHKADLAALKALVDGQKGEIEGIIFRDKMSGIKGLIGAMSSNVCEYIDPLKYPTLPKSSEALKFYLDPITDYIRHQLRTPPKIPGQEPEPREESKKVGTIRLSLDRLLDHLEKPKLFAYDHTFVDLRNYLNGLLTALHPSSFADSPSPLLAPLKAGLAAFTAQLGHAYVSRYSGRHFNGALLKDKVVKPGEAKQNQPEKELTTEGRNCAKVCLTILEILGHDLGRLRRKCKKDWKHFQIHRGTQKLKSDVQNPLGHFFWKCGYEVADSAAKQNGHLRNQASFKGQNVFDCLASTNDYKHVFFANDDTRLDFEFLCDYVQDYYAVGHYATSFAKKQPCSVYEMLNWICGLKYNPVQSDLLHSISDMLEEPATPVGGDSEGLVSFDMNKTYLNAYPYQATYKQLDEVINHIISKSSSILTTVLGYGDEHTTYACEFYDNSLKLYYPKSGEECLDMLLDILRRMFPPLRFLFMQCRLDQSHYGWADCYYGEDVYPLNWQCKEHEAEKAECRPRSALQSYLSDCLVGCMPHQLSAIGCKATCTTCPKGQPGMPCLTPLGFRGFSGSKRRGEDLSNVLGNLFSDPLLASLFALSPKAPSTLPEHFQFALSLVYDWQNNRSHPIENGIKAAIMDRSIALYEQTSDLTNALSNAYGSSRTSHGKEKHPKPVIQGKQDDDTRYGDLSSLAMSTACPDQLCAPYLYALCTDQYDYLASKQCKTYLSWAVYLPWTFWNNLNSLYNAFKDIYCQDWGCRTCLRADTCRRGQHGLVNDKTKDVNCHCSSIVECKGVMPTLYKYGFTFGAPAALNGQSGKKTCTNFMDQLNNVLQSTYFKTLFDKCDDFLWQIRQPFTWTVVALWLLSFLYLLHIMVIRLDLFHIKSHLHSPLSHRIAAQSLLASARVNKLNRVFYLQG